VEQLALLRTFEHGLSPEGPEKGGMRRLSTEHWTKSVQSSPLVARSLPRKEMTMKSRPHA